MTEETLELQDSPNLEDTFEVFADDDQETETSPESQPDFTALENRLSELEKQNKQLYERAKKAEAVKKENLQVTDTTPNYEDRLERQDLRIEGYTAEEADFIIANGGRKALDNSLVKSAIEANRAKRKTLEATPQSGGKSPVYKRYTMSELENMPLEKLEALLPKG